MVQTKDVRGRQDFTWCELRDVPRDVGVMQLRPSGSIERVFIAKPAGISRELFLGVGAPSKHKQPCESSKGRRPPTSSRQRILRGQMQ